MSPTTAIPPAVETTPPRYAACCDYSGQWAYCVGIPAKSGVGGGVMAVVNRQIGIATYSPRLDSYGNSRRGIEVCVELASRLGLHVFDCLNVGSKFLGESSAEGESFSG